MGLKTEGSASPVPHSESEKVLGPKWRKRAMLPSCHWSCRAEGRGKMGRGGGGLTRNEFTQERSERRTRKVIWEMGFVGL